jgi:hypothetical protein
MEAIAAAVRSIIGGTGCFVMAGPVLAIHVFFWTLQEDVDARDERRRARA